MDYLFSIHTQFANMIFDGSKTVELRSRRVQMEFPSRLWIYVTTPEKELKGFATVSSVDHDIPANIWKSHKQNMGLNAKQFKEYAGSRSIISAITVSEVIRLERPIALARLKEVSPVFHPPQFYMDLSSHPSLSQMIKEEISELVA